MQWHRTLLTKFDNGLALMAPEFACNGFRLVVTDLKTRVQSFPSAAHSEMCDQRVRSSVSFGIGELR